MELNFPSPGDSEGPGDGDLSGSRRGGGRLAGPGTCVYQRRSWLWGQVHKNSVLCCHGVCSPPPPGSEAQTLGAGVMAGVILYSVRETGH